MHVAFFYFFWKYRLTGQDTNAVRQYFVAYFMFWEGIFMSTLWPRFWNSCQFHKQQQLSAKRGLELLRIEVPYGIYVCVYSVCVYIHMYIHIYVVGKKRDEVVVILTLLFVLLSWFRLG